MSFLKRNEFCDQISPVFSNRHFLRIHGIIWNAAALGGGDRTAASNGPSKLVWQLGRKSGLSHGAGNQQSDYSPVCQS
jgi:hypothetical protein